jgi:hypothetical protein
MMSEYEIEGTEVLEFRIEKYPIYKYDEIEGGGDE